jgi:hypothetical protein
MLLGTLELSSFDAVTRPAPVELGRALEGRANTQPVLQLRFGEMVAGLPISDVWSACCELLLQAQLAREMRLDRFVLDLEQVFDVTCAAAPFSADSRPSMCLPCRGRDSRWRSSGVAEQIFAGTSCPSLMHIAACWGASTIRAI